MLVEVQPAVTAAEEQQRVHAGVEAGLNHPPDQDVMVPAIMHGVALALEYAQRILEDRGTRFAARPGGITEPVFGARREGDRRRLLLALEHVDREARSGRQRLRRDRL